MTFLLQQGAFPEAAAWFRRAANLRRRAGHAGYPGGYRMAGELALAGSAGQVDRDKGTRLMREAAQAGDVQAQFRLSSLLGAAARRPQEMAEPVDWLRRAAAGGHAMAADQLGLLSVAGLGLPQDLAAARQWFEQAASAGWVPAKVRLAQLLL